MSLTKPQSWNRYAYALNNPLALIDPNGLSVKRHHAHGMNEDEDEDDDDDDDGGDGGSDGSGDGNSGDDSGPGAAADSPCRANVTVGGINETLSGISPSLPTVLNNTKQYFQQAGVSLSFNYESQPSSTLDFANTAQMKDQGELLDVPGETDCANDGSGCESWINTAFIAQEMATAGPGASYVQGVTSQVEHELIHNLTGDQVGNSVGEDTADIMGGFSDSDYYASPPMTQAEIISLQTATCPQGDFGGNSGPVEGPPPDVPAVARPRIH